jgi:hypothetical protein
VAMLNNIIEIGGLAATAINIIQSQRIHEDETSHAQKRHDESMNVAKIQHEKDLKIAKQTYLMAAFTSLEQHFQVNFCSEPISNCSTLFCSIFIQI